MLLLAVGATAGCSGNNASAPPVDINNAAKSAQSDISNYAADRVKRAPRLQTPDRVVSQPTPVSAANDASDGQALDAAAARDVVQSYFRLISAGQFAEAHQLWDRDGAASGSDAVGFARRFARYGAYDGTTGAPSRVDAGAGQRYVTVPVTVTGRLHQGDRPFAMAGTATLHRAAAIDGATPAQRRWRISAMELRPGPDDTASTTNGMPATATARFTCNDGFAFAVRFDNRADVARLTQDDKVIATLSGERPASGIWYKAPGWELRGKGRDVDLTRTGQPPRKCHALD